MSQLLGIRNLNSDISVESLKRDLLVFDKLLIVGIQERDHVFYPNKSEDNPLKKRTLPFLHDFIIYQGYKWMKKSLSENGNWEKACDEIATDETDFLNQNIEFLENKGALITDYSQLKSNLFHKNTFEHVNVILRERLDKIDPKSSRDFLDLNILAHDIKIRMLAASIDRSIFTPIMNNSSIYAIKDLTSMKSTVYDLVLGDFPIIDTSLMSWEQIFDFKDDEEVRNSIWGLRNWITNISKSDRKINEIEEEYRHLKYQYSQSIKIHKLKTSSSILQMVLQNSVELVENIAKLKFKSASDMLFKLKKNRIALMETELNSRGNQLSYLFKVKEKFQ